MQAQRYRSICNCPHEKKAISEVNSRISLCFNCSSVIIRNDQGKDISTIKPSKFSVVQETSTPIFLSIQDTHKPYEFRNKSDYLKIRTLFVKKLKFFCSTFELCKKTYFVALDFFDRVCSKIPSFEINDLIQILQICLILSAKFNEPQIKTRQIKTYLNLTNNYSKDELFILQVLDYDLYVHTSYDILLDMMHTGFLFSDEKFSLKKMNLIYGKLENMLYFFSETKLYIDMTHTEIALSLIGLTRETLGTIAYNSIMKSIFMSEYSAIETYYSCLKKIRKFFKIKNGEKNELNSTDSSDNNNSDNNFDNNDNISDNNSKIINNSHN